MALIACMPCSLVDKSTLLAMSVALMVYPAVWTELASQIVISAVSRCIPPRRVQIYMQYNALGL